MHKRGILFYGPAGGGKTCIVKQIINNLTEKYSGVVIDGCSGDPHVIKEILNQLRAIEPNRKVICVFEDIDSYIQICGESRVLSFLDGEDSFNNMVMIATTNYPKRLDKRLVCRPRRFDRVIKIEMPDEAIRREYFQRKLKITNKEIEEYVELTKDFSFGAMTELVISTKCFDIPLHEAVEILRNLMYEKRDDEDDFGYGKVGFQE